MVLFGLRAHISYPMLSGEQELPVRCRRWLPAMGRVVSSDVTTAVTARGGAPGARYRERESVRAREQCGWRMANV